MTTDPDGFADPTDGMRDFSLPFLAPENGANGETSDPREPVADAERRGAVRALREAAEVAEEAPQDTALGFYVPPWLRARANAIEKGEDR